METLKKYAWQTASVILGAIVLYLAANWAGAELALKDSQKKLFTVTGERDLARSEIIVCEDKRRELRGALDSQNDAITDLNVDTEKKLQAMRDIVAATKRDNEKFKNRIKDLLKPVAGNSVCERFLEFDKRLVEDLKNE